MGNFLTTKYAEEGFKLTYAERTRTGRKMCGWRKDIHSYFARVLLGTFQCHCFRNENLLLCFWTKLSATAGLCERVMK
jgi:hypothetical protein